MYQVGGSMCGMKTDMGGAAAMLAAFRAAVLGGLQSCDLHLVMCIAENAIGPGAVRSRRISRIYKGIRQTIIRRDLKCYKAKYEVI
jgi:probable aminopeptidase NPEPL1